MTSAWLCLVTRAHPPTGAKERPRVDPLTRPVRGRTPTSPTSREMLSDAAREQRRQPAAGRGAQGHGHRPARPGRDGHDRRPAARRCSSSDAGEAFNVDAGHRRRPQDGHRGRRHQPSARPPAARWRRPSSVADLWLDDGHPFAAPGVAARAWSRAEWVEATMPVWRTLVEPVAAGVERGRRRRHARPAPELGDGSQLPPGSCPPAWTPAAMIGQMEPMLAKMSGVDVRRAGRPGGRRPRRRGASAAPRSGCRSSPDRPVALLPANVAAFAEGLEVDLDRGAPLPRPARGRPPAAVRPRAVARRRSWSPRSRTTPAASASTPSRSRRRCSGRPHRPEPRCSGAAGPAVRAPSRRPRSGPRWPGWRPTSPWSRAGSTSWPTGPPRDHLPQAAALREAVRRRRATGGPAEQAFAAPGRARAAAAPAARRRQPVGRAASQHGAGRAATRCGRTPTWCRPRADLDDPLGYVERRAAPAAAPTSTPPSTRCSREGESGSGTATSRLRRRRGPAPAPPTGVPAAYLALRDDAAAEPLAAWDRARRRSRRRCAHELPRAPARPTPTRCGSRAAGAPDRERLVLDAAREQVLLTLHRKAGLWFQFGGHFEPDDADARRGGDPRGPRGVRDRRPRAATRRSSHLDRHAARCGLRPVPRAPRPAVRRRVAPTGAGHAVSEESLDVAGGRSTRCRPRPQRRARAGSSRPPGVCWR